MRQFGTLVAVVCVSFSSAWGNGYEGLSDAEVQAAAGEAIRARTAEVVDMCVDTHSTLRAMGEVLVVRQDAFEKLQSVRKLTELEGILLADSIDDSLVYHMGDLTARFAESNPEPLFNAGTEKFNSTITRLGFVRDWSTGFLVHLELEQMLLVLGEYKSNRSEAEVEAGEDALLRHVHQLTQLYRVQHRELEDLHGCNVANMEWVMGRIESENGTTDFYVAQQMFAQRETGFAYLMKLASPTTGEILDVFYPLPYLTRMDAGWERHQQRLREKREAEAAKQQG